MPSAVPPMIVKGSDLMDIVRSWTTNPHRPERWVDRRFGISPRYDEFTGYAHHRYAPLQPAHHVAGAGGGDAGSGSGSTRGPGSMRCVISGAPTWNTVVGCACQTAISGDDGDKGYDTFAANLPPELREKPFVRVKGTIKSAPLDLPKRAEQFRKEISKSWLWFEYGGFDTDVSTFLGIPLPKSYAFEGVMTPRDGHKPTEDEAQHAVSVILAQLELNYSPTGAWLHEIKQEVVQPTLASISEKVDTAKKYGPWIIGGILALIGVHKLRLI